ncbi:MAG TPA: hypothetical protein VL093_08025 [Flavipsychrobacter sp.]|jgi:hypothetical protein|nr:hypothetical protein [Flavipsychrobacter sp.]
MHRIVPALFLFLFLFSCKKGDDSVRSLNGQTFIGTEVRLQGPLRVFTSDGEITDPAVIKAFLDKGFHFKDYQPIPFKDSLIFSKDSVLIKAADNQESHSYAVQSSGNDLTFIARDSTIRPLFIPRIIGILEQAANFYSIKKVYDGQNGKEVHQLDIIKANRQNDEILMPVVGYYFINGGFDVPEDIISVGGTESGTLKTSISPDLVPGDTLALLSITLSYHQQ